MYRLIYSAQQTNTFNPGIWIKKVSKYLYEHIDGAFKIKFNAMDCEVWMRMYYQVLGKPQSFDEMIFVIDTTSYQNKLRINLTENTAMEKTIGQIILGPNQLGDIETVRATVLQKIQKYIAKEYADYDFVY